MSDFESEEAVKATIAELQKRIAELEALRFTPTGDNHHNALKCPYCNPERIDPAAERQRREVLERYAASIAMWMDRENVTDQERLSYIKGHPVTRAAARAADRSR